MSSKVGFVFAGLHTLDEMTANYFNPFFGSLINIHVSFLKREATRRILTNPNDEFPLEYSPEAIDRIYDLTHGQPYLVQLIGFHLVRRYNNQVFEQGKSRESVFTVKDVEHVIGDREFFKQGRYYFHGVWGQIKRGGVAQQAVLQELRLEPKGLSRNDLSELTSLNQESLQEALKALKRYDVVAEVEGKWRIIVELFRLWLKSDQGDRI